MVNKMDPFESRSIILNNVRSSRILDKSGLNQSDINELVLRLSLNAAYQSDSSESKRYKIIKSLEQIEGLESFEDIDNILCTIMESI